MWKKRRQVNGTSATRSDIEAVGHEVSQAIATNPHWSRRYKKWELNDVARHAILLPDLVCGRSFVADTFEQIRFCRCRWPWEFWLLRQSEGQRKKFRWQRTWKQTSFEQRISANYERNSKLKVFCPCSSYSFGYFTWTAGNRGFSSRQIRIEIEIRVYTIMLFTLQCIFAQAQKDKSSYETTWKDDFLWITHCPKALMARCWPWVFQNMHSIPNLLMVYGHVFAWSARSLDGSNKRRIGLVGVLSNSQRSQDLWSRNFVHLRPK